jgi:hypothetical protein
LEEIIMLNKRIMSLTMAGVLALSMAAPALADDAPSNTANSTTAANSTEITVTHKDVTIDVTVPTTGTAYINPYALPIKVGTDKDGNDVKITGQQITTVPMAITNDGDIALTVGASVTTTATGAAKIKTAKLEKTDTEASVYAQLQVVSSNIVGEKTKDATTIASNVLTLGAKDATWESATSLTLDSAQKAEKSGMVTLAASTIATQTVSGQSTTTTTYNKGSVALVRLTGSVVESPATDWVAADGFKAVVAYTFKPATT